MTFFSSRDLRGGALPLSSHPRPGRTLGSLPGGLSPQLPPVPGAPRGLSPLRPPAQPEAWGRPLFDDRGPARAGGARAGPRESGQRDPGGRGAPGKGGDPGVRRGGTGAQRSPQTRKGPPEQPRLPLKPPPRTGRRTGHDGPRRSRRLGGIHATGDPEAGAPGGRGRAGDGPGVSSEEAGGRPVPRGPGPGYQLWTNPLFAPERPAPRHPAHFSSPCSSPSSSSLGGGERPPRDRLAPGAAGEEEEEEEEEERSPGEMGRGRGGWGSSGDLPHAPRLLRSSLGSGSPGGSPVEEDRGSSPVEVVHQWLSKIPAAPLPLGWELGAGAAQAPGDGEGTEPEGSTAWGPPVAARPSPEVPAWAAPAGSGTPWGPGKTPDRPDPPGAARSGPGAGGPGRASSLPEVSPAMGRKLRCSLQALVTCLAQLRLFGPETSGSGSGPGLAAAGYQELLGALQGLGLGGRLEGVTPRRAEPPKAPRGDPSHPSTNGEGSPVSSSGVDVRSGSGGSGEGSLAGRPDGPGGCGETGGCSPPNPDPGPAPSQAEGGGNGPRSGRGLRRGPEDEQETLGGETEAAEIGDGGGEEIQVAGDEEPGDRNSGEGDKDEMSDRETGGEEEEEAPDEETGAGDPGERDREEMLDQEAGAGQTGEGDREETPDQETGAVETGERDREQTLDQETEGQESPAKETGRAGEGDGEETLDQEAGTGETAEGHREESLDRESGVGQIGEGDREEVPDQETRAVETGEGEREETLDQESEGQESPAKETGRAGEGDGEETLDQEAGTGETAEGHREESLDRESGAGQIGEGDREEMPDQETRAVETGEGEREETLDQESEGQESPAGEAGAGRAGEGDRDEMLDQETGAGQTGEGDREEMRDPEAAGQESLAEETGAGRAGEGEREDTLDQEAGPGDSGEGAGEEEGIPPGAVQRKERARAPDLGRTLRLLRKVERELVARHARAAADRAARWGPGPARRLAGTVGELRRDLSRRLRAAVRGEVRKLRGRAGRPEPPPAPPVATPPTLPILPAPATVQASPRTEPRRGSLRSPEEEEEEEEEEPDLGGPGDPGERARGQCSSSSGEEEGPGGGGGRGRRLEGEDSPGDSSHDSLSLRSSSARSVASPPGPGPRPPLYSRTPGGRAGEKGSGGDGRDPGLGGAEPGGGPDLRSATSSSSSRQGDGVPPDPGFHSTGPLAGIGEQSRGSPLPEKAAAVFDQGDLDF
ncbi:collagen alpha-1(I) chain-like [Ornithorhynchus anatinus]|uniref:collagen alpha-1(I) chain-like n=1 Tax=Ornithorhynchus anatinus TaxID=9258 RepID=UPI0010A7CB4E|nr:collagen alpha-1(I) chain-like [Ornithorhynchus anatinus]